MSKEIETSAWHAVCSLNDILPNTGVCALVNNKHVAVFHVDNGSPQLYAIDNYDPNSQASVLSRGLIGNLGERIVVASPIYKQHFDLKNGECLEAPENSVNAYPVRLDGGRIWVAA